MNRDYDRFSKENHRFGVSPEGFYGLDEKAQGETVANYFERFPWTVVPLSLDDITSEDFFEFLSVPSLLERLAFGLNTSCFKVWRRIRKRVDKPVLRSA